jgi:hypothetical protein
MAGLSFSWVEMNKKAMTPQRQPEDRASEERSDQDFMTLRNG